MASTVTPKWTHLETPVIPPVSLIKGSKKESSIIDITDKFGGYLHVFICKFGTTAFSTTGIAPCIRVFSLISDSEENGSEIITVSAETQAAWVKQIDFASGYQQGVSDFALKGTGTPAFNDIICITGVTSIPATNNVSLETAEWFTVSAYLSVNGVPTLTTATASKFAHSNNEYVTNKATAARLWLPGGAKYKVVADYGGETAATQAIGIKAELTVYESDIVS